MASEADIALVVVASLQADGWDVYQEVECAGGRADIVATRPGLVWAIETKMVLSLSVIAQATRRVDAHLRSVAVPFPKGKRPDELYRHRLEPDSLFAFKVCQRFGVGVLMVAYPPPQYERAIQEYVRPEFHRPPKMWLRNLVDHLHPEQMTFCPAGTPGGHHWTPWKGTMKRVRDFLTAHPGATLKEINDAIGDTHYHSAAGLTRGLQAAIKHGWIPWCRVEYAKGGMRLFVQEVTDAKGAP